MSVEGQPFYIPDKFTADDYPVYWIGLNDIIEENKGYWLDEVEEVKTNKVLFIEIRLGNLKVCFNGYGR